MSPPHRPAHSTLFLALSGLVICLGLAACGASVGSRQDYTEGVDPVTGEPNSNYSTEAKIYGDADEQRLESARAFARKREYATAIPTFEEMAADQRVKPKFREEALFSLGEAQGAVFNPHKNYELAVLTLKRFLTLYPDSDRADEARSLIANYEQILEQL